MTFLQPGHQVPTLALEHVALIRMWFRNKTTPSLFHMDVQRSGVYSDADDEMLSLLGFYAIFLTRYKGYKGNLVYW